MKTNSHIARESAAYTLLELLVAVTTASAIFLVILTSGVAIYRSCSMADDYSQQANEQMRAVDYISRDVRSALSVSIPADGLSLTVTLPDCYSSYDSGGIPMSAPIDPVIADGVPQYGDAAQPVVVTYYISDGKLIRDQYMPATSQTAQLVVASNVSGFVSNFVPLNCAATISLTFAPQMHQGITSLRPGTTVSVRVSARKLRQKLHPAI